MDLAEFDKRKIRFLLMPMRFPPAHLKDDYLRAYACWREVWGMALKNEMNVTEELYADNFTRHSHLAAVFYDDEVVSLTTFDFFEMSFAPDRDDSCFRYLPEITKSRIRKDLGSFIVAGNFTLNFNYRRGAHNINWKDLMLIFQIRILRSTSVDGILGAVRIEKGMEKAAYRTGAFALAKDLPYTIPGQRVDLVCWHRNIKDEDLDPELCQLVDFVWKNRANIIESYDQKKGERHAA